MVGNSGISTIKKNPNFGNAKTRYLLKSKNHTKTTKSKYMSKESAFLTPKAKLAFITLG